MNTYSQDEESVKERIRTFALSKKYLFNNEIECIRVMIFTYSWRNRIIWHCHFFALSSILTTESRNILKMALKIAQKVPAIAESDLYIPETYYITTPLYAAKIL